MDKGKLINEYRKRILELDHEIGYYTEQIRLERSKQQTSEQYIRATAEDAELRRIANAQRQIYIQVIKDLEDVNN